MKTFNLFGKKIIMRIENKKKKDNVVIKKDKLKMRLVIFIFIFIFSGISFDRNIFKSTYSVGEKAQKNVYSPVSIEYKLKKDTLESEQIVKFKNIQKGEILVRKGEELKQEDLNKLKITGVYLQNKKINYFMGSCLYLFIIGGIFFYIAKKTIKTEVLNNKLYYSTLLIMLAMLIIMRIIPLEYIYIFPFGALVLLIGLLSNQKYTLIISTFVLLSIFSYSNFNYVFLIMSLLELIISVYALKKIKTRTDIINIALYIGILKASTMISFNLILNLDLFKMFFNLIEVFSSGILSGMITIAFLPYLENTFNILTEIKLLELADFSNPLLRKLLLNAPGTFHHSILVATLAERAAEVIGANSTFARVASYYHDVGKLKRPNFYVENQKNGINPHEKLTPSLSSLIITSHTKDGDKLGREYKIPEEIRNVMLEHQGTTLLAYFYNKAKKENEDINESDFRYSGPKPRSKESAIIMLADSIEAAVRSLDEKNKLTIRKMIRKIVNNKIDTEQLAEAELTFKDIEKIIAAFTEVVEGIYHSRIKYPEEKKD